MSCDGVGALFENRRPDYLLPGLCSEPEEPPPYTVVNPGGGSPLLLVCDHASNYIPAHLCRLGLSAEALSAHIAWDIGAALVTRGLAARLDAMAVLAGYSRLLVDLNRSPQDPSRMPAVTCGVDVPGNSALDAETRAEREETLFHPYHQAVDRCLARLCRQGPLPAVVAIHSFTPRLNGKDRPWHVGILWNQDARLALPVIEALEREPGLCVGDNLPYSGREMAYTLDIHAAAAGLPHVGIEIRNDQIADEAGCARWVDLLGDLLQDRISCGGGQGVGANKGC